jgi:hypothetical protein
LTLRLTGNRNIGMWRSLVAHFVRDEGVGGSNPLIPTRLYLLFINILKGPSGGLSVHIAQAIGDDRNNPFLT